MMATDSSGLSAPPSRTASKQHTEPIPVLDGGHLVYFAAEGVLRRPLPDRVMLWGQQFGIVFIVLLMGLAFYNDFLSLIQ